jgi:D-3-phosphoglycerate dehydrogenase / 2-oxoglutarate reductase
MKDWKVLVADGLSEVGIRILADIADVDDRDGISADELLQVIGEYDALIVRSRTKVTPAVLQAGSKRLSVVGRAGVGVDNINLPEAEKLGITVVNSPTAATVAVAELTMALMMSLARNVAHADEAMKAGQWIKKQLEGNELYGKTLGIIGLGRIGSAVAERASSFGMPIVLGYDTAIAKQQALQALGFNTVTLDELYTRADYISVHVPLTPETRGMINADSIAKMKPGVRIVCTARGGIIDEDALLAALNAGHVAGAGLDVFATEPPGLTELVAHPNVIATPHIGAQTQEAQTRAGIDIAREISAALRSEPLRWKVV